MSRLQDVILRGTRANQPLATAVAVGTIYYVTDETVLERSNGAGWQSYSGAGGGGAALTVEEIDGTPTVANVIKIKVTNGTLTDDTGGIVTLTTGGGSAALPSLTPPINGDFAWINQGSAAVVATGGTVYLSAPVDAGTVDWKIRKKAAPATPYTITATLLRPGLCVNYTQFGLLFRNSGSGLIHSFGVQFNSAVPPGLLLNSAKYASPTSYNATYLSTPFIIGRMVLLRIADNGTSRICSMSPDGVNWIPYHTIGRTDYFTADEVGFGLDVSNTTFPSGITLASWVQG